MWQPGSGREDKDSPPIADKPCENGKGKQTITHQPSIRRRTIQDHRGTDVRVVWHAINDEVGTWGPTPLFAYEIYLLHGARAAARDIDQFADDLLSFIGVLARPGARRNCSYRLDIYTEPLQNVLACVSHHRKEIFHRMANRAYPRLVSEWDVDPTVWDANLYQTRIIVVDQDDWQDQRAILAYSDLTLDEDLQLEGVLDGAGGGGFSHGFASRINLQSEVKNNLIDWFHDADRQALEQGRSDTNLSPVRYPAQDPLARFDADHEGVPELAATTTESVANDFHLDSDADRSAYEKMDTFSVAELYAPASELRSLWSESHSDHFGSSVVSVWDSRLSKTRPPFSFSLYLAFDLPHVEAEALFACLNKGLIAQEAWTLDIVRNIPSIDSTLDYHTRTSSRRNLEKTAGVRSCTQMLLAKIASPRLPAELLEYIEELLVPPVIPDYSNRPSRPFRNFFVYLSRDRINQGPLPVYSNNALFAADLDDQGRPLANANRWRVQPLRTREACRVLDVRNLPFWNRVSAELHILWSVCSPRADVMTMPLIKLTLKLPEIIRWDSFWDAFTEGLEYELDFPEAIIIGLGHDVFSHRLMEMYDIVDLTCGTVLPKIPNYVPLINSHLDTWEATPQLGFDPEETCRATLAPGRGA